jgi:hypothetical protein
VDQVVKISVNGGQVSNVNHLFDYDRPTITGLDPANGPTTGTNLLTVFGTSFGGIPGTITIGTSPTPSPCSTTAPGTSWTHTQIICQVRCVELRAGPSTPVFLVLVFEGCTI